MKSISISVTKFFFQVHYLEESREECQSSESARCNLLTAIDAILMNLLAEEENYWKWGVAKKCQITLIAGLLVIFDCPECVDWLI